ncbi:hypothetical protein CN692_24130 [Bacillus sp. AFS002410]|uniref:hypothetical protein n=1 Tax=Bacillus sp. AFS002410 TaxID=2033481 RepID=UPI000BF0D36F|nr:hypothetical protein [Bacillus sp. AFS002410]PEJ48199.1 hypothetical protein CN692_24130 [Bacillus sp. AFS002410]
MGIFSSIAKGAVKSINRNGIRQMYYDNLWDTQLLRGSEHLKILLKDAIKYKKEENAQLILNHMKQYKVGDIDSYRIVIKMAKKAFKHLDFTDLF